MRMEDFEKNSGVTFKGGIGCDVKELKENKELIKMVNDE